MAGTNFIDKLFELFRPSAALERAKSRILLDRVKQYESKRKYDAASKGSRHTAGWLSNGNSPNQEIALSLSTLRERSRDLARNNPYALNTLRIYANNTIGTGIIPSIKIEGKRIDKKFKEKWKAWATDINCDYDCNLTFYGMQHLAMRATVESGECLIVRIHATKEYDIPLRLQLLEADYIDSTKYDPQTATGGMIYYGIEYDSKGRRTHYWIYDKHPHEFAAKSRRVDANDVIHLFEVERPGQIRGVPFSKTTMLRMNDLDDYEFAERTRNKISAAFAGFVTMDEGGTNTEEDLFDKIEPGAIMRMNPGEKIEFSDPPTNNGYAEFVKNNLRGIAAGNGITYEAMTSDLSNVNFSSGRMGWIEMSRNINHLQYNMFIPKLCAGVMKWFIEAAQLKGYIKFDIEYTIDWTPPRREMIDPYKEVVGKIAEIQGGLTSLSESQRENGFNPDDLADEQLTDKLRSDKMGLIFSSDPRYDLVAKKVDPAAMHDNSAKTGQDTVRL